MSDRTNEAPPMTAAHRAASQGPPAVALEGVQIRYGAVVAVHDVSLEVPPGEVHVLLGRSGSGKTTLLRAIAGFEGISVGRLALRGRIVDDGRSRVPPERREVGVVFQDYALFPHLDVAGNIGFGMPRRDPAAVHALLEDVGLAGYGARPVSALSGGEQQRVALARALAQRPSLVLMDEPFSNLNPELRHDLRDRTVALLREQGVTVVLVTHDRQEAFAVADRISVIREGRLLQTGAARALYETPSSVDVARSVGDVVLLPATPGDGWADTPLGRVPLRSQPGASAPAGASQAPSGREPSPRGAPSAEPSREPSGPEDDQGSAHQAADAGPARLVADTAPEGPAVEASERGAAAHLLILRPEQLQLSLDGPGVTGAVLRVTYHGATDQILASVDGHMLQASAPPGLLTAGQPVRVTVAGPGVCVPAERG